MKFKNKIFIISLLMFILFTISFVSASPNDTLTAGDADNVLTSNEDNIQMESVNNVIQTKTNDKSKIGSVDGEIQIKSIKNDILNSSNENNPLSENDELTHDQFIDKKTTNIKKESGNDELTYRQFSNQIYATGFGDTLTLNRDVCYNGDDDQPHISITKSIIIDGQNHYISGDFKKGIFRFDDSDGGITLTLENLILKNAISDNGGVIHTKKNVNINIINCTFIDNEALEDGGAIYFDSTGDLYISDSTFERCRASIVEKSGSKHNGGAINTQDGNLIIENCTFTNNTAGFGYGGAIYLNGECRSINESVFEYNTANTRFGGAIYVDTSNNNGLAIDNSIFMNNTSLANDRKHGSGGAVYYEGKGVVKLTNSNFTGNKVLGSSTWNKNEYEASRSTYKSRGGAVCSLHDMWIGNCTFIKNHAVDQGGAVDSEEGIWWLDENSVFISNTVGHSNVHLANKGGAIYASTFLNNPKGLIFIDNHGWYGGAIYIHNKNELTFESCVFINNSVWNNDGKDAPGAAIYMDSTGSKLTLINNIFYRNSATDDAGVYNCGSYGTIKNNWYGYNDVNFANDAYLLEWHRVGSNDKKEDSNPLKVTLTANQTEVFHSPVKLTLKFVCNDNTEFTGKLTNWTVDFSSNNKGMFSDLQIGDNEATVIFTPEPGNHVVTAKVHGQELSVNINQISDFRWLQQQIDETPAGGILSLNRNLTYSYAVDSEPSGGVHINKPITIDGNGYTINGLNIAKLFTIHSSDVTIQNLTLLAGRGRLYKSGAISTDDGTSNLQVINCTFIDNIATDIGGGAILLESTDSKIINSSFFNNEASQGGAIDIRSDNVLIDGCEFRNNTATTEIMNGGGAINNFGENVIISNSVFLDNKAMADDLDTVVNDSKLIITLAGMQNYINAIYSSQKIKFNNVTYWDGEVTTGSNPIYSANESGQNITLEIYNDNNQIVKHVDLVTDKNGQAVYDFSKLDSGNYTFKAIHYEDNYYANYKIDEGSFNYTRVSHYPSEVKINIPDAKEFYYGDCNISFTVTNRSEVEVYITNANSEVLYDNMTDLNYVEVNLPASDEEYFIFVYNWGNETINPSSDYKTFKILKINSTVSTDPVVDVNYGQNVSLSFAGDGTSYNVTVYDKNNEIVFSKITNDTSIDIANLSAGEYNVTIINLGSENMIQSMVSTTFKVDKLLNNFKVKVEDGVYGHDIAVSVTADVDGDYTVDINSRIITLYVENGQATITVDDLAAGTYNANVSFANDNYINNATNCTFTVQKGQSHVEIMDMDENITMNQNKSIRFADFYPGKYNVTIYDSNNQIVKSEIWDSLLYSILISDVGTYNLTVTNLGNDNVAGSTASYVFNVNMDNNVEVYVEDTEYGRELFISIIADADGDYTVNINGTEITIEVTDGIGEYWDLVDLNAGDYTTEVTFANPNYINIINNTNFTIYPVESNIKIYEIGNVSYGEDVNVRFHENYPTVFYIEVFDSNNETVLNTTFVYEDTSPEMNVILSDLDIGEYKVVIENLGDDENILANSSFMYFNVTKPTVITKLEEKINELEELIANLTAPKDTNIVIDPIVDAKYGDEIVISGLLLNEDSTSLSNQVITLKFNDEEVELTTRGGEFKYTTTITTVGENTITVTYAGNNKYNPSEATTTFTSQKADIDISFDDIAAVKKGEKITITATVTDHNNNPMANTVIKLLINNGRKTLKTDSEGILTYDYALTKIGQNNITATFQENEYYNEAIENLTVEVLPLNTIITINPIDPVAKGESVTITGTLTDENGEKIANAQIKVFVNGSPKTIKTDANGVFTHTYVMGKTGINNISVSYDGSNSYVSTNATTTVEVSKSESVIIIDSIDTINKGDNVTISGRITDKNNNPVANAQVKITINGSPKTVKCDSNGVFIYNYIMNRIGENDITVIFNGNNNFLATNTTSIVNVVKA